MRLWLAMAAGVLLAGCVTARTPGGPADAELARQVERAARGLRALTREMEAGNAPDFAAAFRQLELAQAAVLAAGSQPAGLERLAGHAALGVTLALCREGLDRLEQRFGADPAAMPDSGFRMGCVVPLTLVAAGLEGR